MSKKLLLIVCIPLVFQLAATACMTWFASHLVMVAQHQYEAKAIIGCANWLSFEVASAPLFWMVKNLSGDDEYSKQWKLREEGCHKTLQELKEVLQEQPGQAQKVDGLAQVINSFLQTLHTIDQMPDLSPQSKVERLARSPEFKRFFVQYPYLRSSILASHRHAFDVAKVPFIPDQGLPVESRTLQDRSNWLTMGLWEVWILTGILAAAVLVISRGLTRRVAVVTENARLLAADRPLYPAIGGDDEVALLDDTFHSMARAIKEAAEKERAIIRHASDVICSIDPNDCLVVVNPACLTVLDYAPDELAGRSISEIVFQDDLERTMNFLAQARANTIDQNFESRLCKKDGTVIDVLWSVSLSESDRSIFCVLHDVTARRRMESMKEEFVSMLSHDLRTPLSSIQAFLELAAIGTYDRDLDTLKRKARGVESEIDRLIGIISTLLNVYKLEAGKLEMYWEVIPCSRIVERSLQSVVALAEKQKITINQSDFEGGIHVKADEDYIVQVLVNLLSNAIKFSPKNSSIDISVEPTDLVVKISVTDKGPGIAREVQQRLFNRFEQANISDTRIKGGTGLGLAFARAIVEQHGGNIGVESQEGEGSTFWFTLPKIDLQGAE